MHRAGKDDKQVEGTHEIITEMNYPWREAENRINKLHLIDLGPTVRKSANAKLWEFEKHGKAKRKAGRIVRMSKRPPKVIGTKRALIRMVKRANLVRMAKRPSLIRMAKRLHLVRIGKRSGLIRMARRPGVVRIKEREDKNQRQKLFMINNIPQRLRGMKRAPMLRMM